MSKTLAEMIAVMTAAAAGAKIDARCVTALEHDRWEQLDGFFWNWQHYDYRVRPKPPKAREGWVYAGNIMPIQVEPEMILVRQVLPDDEHVKTDKDKLIDKIAARIGKPIGPEDIDNHEQAKAMAALDWILKPGP